MLLTQLICFAVAFTGGQSHTSKPALTLLSPTGVAAPYLKILRNAPGAVWDKGGNELLPIPKDRLRSGDIVLVLIDPADVAAGMPMTEGLGKEGAFANGHYVYRQNKYFTVSIHSEGPDFWGGPLYAVRTVQALWTADQAKKKESSIKNNDDLQKLKASPAYAKLTLALLKEVGGKTFTDAAKAMNPKATSYKNPALDKVLKVKNAVQRDYVHHWLQVAAQQK